MHGPKPDSESGLSKERDDEAQAESSREDEALAVFCEQPPWRRLVVLACCLFVALHVSAVLLKGVKPGIRDYVWPVFFWYGDGLRMTTTWGMFGAPHKKEALYSVGIDSEGSRHALYPPARGEVTLTQRVIDIRLRKIQSSLLKEKNYSQWGRAYSRYWCEQAPAGIVFREVMLERADGPNLSTHPRHHLLTTKCESSRETER